MIKKLLLLTILISNLLYSADLTVVINNGELKGTAYLALYKGKEGFLKKDSVFKGVKFDLVPNETIINITELPAGDYAYIVFHDENENGTLDTNFMKIPKEPTGSSNNFRPKFKPNYDDFKFTLDEKVTQKIDLK
ncbi:DUF2141 domain-containing protein [Cetobacterium sp. ZWU0022]|uniref:DUF2141 domain-containing protein n=1 Tax=Cetobacterium sp. ZWU0022 TaxID=1340502 RepID=UPI000690DCDE|nr:DUF2141 domain-containing protein [Cetobacterium sp. ZWU0022]